MSPTCGYLMPSGNTCKRTAQNNAKHYCTQHFKIATNNDTLVHPSTPHGPSSEPSRPSSPSPSMERDLPISSHRSSPLICKGSFKTGIKAHQPCGSTNIYPNGYCYKHQSQANSNHSPQNSLNPTFTQSSDPISSKLQKEIAKEERLLTTHQAKLQKAKQEYTIFSTQSQEIESLKDRTATLELYISQLVSQLANLGVSVERPTPQTTPIRHF